MDKFYHHLNFPLPHIKYAFELNHSTVQVALLMVPSTALLLLFPFRTFQLRRASLKVFPNYTGAIKAALTIAIATVQLAALVFCLRFDPHPDVASIAANSVAFVASLAICVVSFLEHGRSVKPSTLLTLYLLAAFSCEAPLLPSLYGYYGGTAMPPILTVAVGLKFILLVIESFSKRSYLREPYRGLPVEQTVSVLSRVSLFWANNIILLGNSKLLSVSDLPELDDALRSKDLRTRMEAAWDKTAKPEPSDNSEGSKTLLMAWFRCFAGSLLLNAVPRLLTTVFTYIQPVLINRVIVYVNGPVTEMKGGWMDFANLTGSQLVIATFVIYVGVAVFECISSQGLQRIIVQSRGALVGLLHCRCLTMLDGVYDDSAAVTLMSSDAINVGDCVRIVQGTLFNLIELTLGMFMLWSELRWWCLSPLIIVGLCSQATTLVSNRIGTAVGEWQSAKQKRLAVTNSMIDYVENIKMTGMTYSVMGKIQDTRLSEIMKNNRFRWMIVWMNISANGLHFLAPVVTLVFYAVDAKFRGQDALDATKAFTSLAIINLVSGPAMNLLGTFPQFATINGSAKRIQKYMLEPSRDDKRLLIEYQFGKVRDNGHASTDVNGSKTSSNVHPAVILDGVSLRPASSADLCLQDMNVQIAQGSLNVICGAVGTGKTTLARAILGDTPPVIGTISVSSKSIGYCAEKPWLTNASIRKIICGPVAESNVDEEWYHRVILACGLAEDIEQLSGGDTTPVGSRGIMLSGGQRQRVVCNSIFDIGISTSAISISVFGPEPLLL